MRILIADDHRLVLEATRSILMKIEETVEVVPCGSFEEALAAAEENASLDLVVLDLRMPGMHGVEGVRDFRSRFPDTPVVILSGQYHVEDILKAFGYGAAGFIPKTASVQTLVSAFKLILSGQKYVPGEVLSAMQNKQISLAGIGDHEKELEPLQRLTPREHEALDLLIEGQSNKEIARALGIQEVTVKLHMRNIFRKLGAANRTQAVRIALQSGW